MVLGIFKIAFHLRDQHIFMWQSVESNIFNTLALKQIFWKTKTFFEKLEHRSFFESTKIEFCDISKNTFFTEHLGVTTPVDIFIVPWSYLLKQSKHLLRVHMQRCELW